MEKSKNTNAKITNFESEDPRDVFNEYKKYITEKDHDLFIKIQAVMICIKPTEDKRVGSFDILDEYVYCPYYRDEFENHAEVIEKTNNIIDNINKFLERTQFAWRLEHFSFTFVEVCLA